VDKQIEKELVKLEKEIRENAAYKGLFDNRGFISLLERLADVRELCRDKIEVNPGDEASRGLSMGIGRIFQLLGRSGDRITIAKSKIEGLKKEAKRELSLDGLNPVVMD